MKVPNANREFVAQLVKELQRVFPGLFGKKEAAHTFKIIADPTSGENIDIEIYFKTNLQTATRITFYVRDEAKKIILDRFTAKKLDIDMFGTEIDDKNYSFVFFSRPVISVFSDQFFEDKIELLALNKKELREMRSILSPHFFATDEFLKTIIWKKKF